MPNKEPSKREEVARLWREGYRTPWIAERLGIKEATVRCYLTQLKACHRPPDGFIDTAAAARASGLSIFWVRQSIQDGYLRAVKQGHRWYTTHEWVKVWLNNHHYRQEADRLAGKLFGRPPSP